MRGLSYDRRVVAAAITSQDEQRLMSGNQSGRGTRVPGLALIASFTGTDRECQWISWGELQRLALIGWINGTDAECLDVTGSDQHRLEWSLDIDRSRH